LSSREWQENHMHSDIPNPKESPFSPTSQMLSEKKEKNGHSWKKMHTGIGTTPARGEG
jgi:hypothetical protein